jgi:hypothetical protein
LELKLDVEFYLISFVTFKGMNHEKNINKMRILNLMSLAENSKELPFELLQKKLQIEVDDIESFIIDGRGIHFFKQNYKYQIIYFIRFSYSYQMH